MANALDEAPTPATTPATTPVVAPAVPGSPEHDANMVSLFESKAGAPEATPEVPATERPAWLPEKFKTAEDMAKAYGELEGKLSQPKPPVEAPPVTPPAAAGGAVDWQALGAEVAADGKLSDASLAAVKAMGIPEDIINGYVSSQVKSVTEFRTSLEAEAGGAQQFETIRQWAAVNLSPGEKAALQGMVEGGVDTAKIAVQTMRARYQAAVGVVPTLLGGVVPGSSGAGFESTAQMVEAMSDPKYAKDPAFRAQVERRLAATTSF